MSIIRIKRTDTSTTPTGLTFGEMAYVQGIKSLYMGQTAGDPALRIGAEVDTSTSLGTSNNKIPTQGAVKAYVDSAVGGGAVGTVNGLTGAVVIAPGTAIGISTAGQNITVTNTGVQSFNGSTGAVTGVSSAVAGTGIAVSSSTGAVTFTNTGVQSLAGTSNQITVSGSTGAVTLSLPSTVTVPGALNVTTDLTVTGSLIVNGTTTTVNSNTMTVDDPLIIIGTSGGVPIAASDGNKDRGIVFNYYDTAGQTGFFGFDASTKQFVFQTRSTVSGEVVTGVSYGDIRAYSFVLSADLTTDTIVPSGALGNQTFVLPGYADLGGTIVASGTYPNDKNNYILKSNTSIGSAAKPTWIDPSATGFTAFTSTNVTTASDTSDAETFIAFVPLASATNQGIKYNSGLTYNAVTNSVSATTFVGAFSGNATTATTATNATNVATTVDTTDVQAFLAFVPLASDTNQGVRYNSGLTYNAVSNSLTATTFVGAHIGNSSTATILQTARNIGITGDINGTATSFNGSADINISAQIAAGTIIDADINAAAGIVDTKLATISTANKVSLTAIDLDGATETTTIIGSDILFVDDGANGTNRKVTVNNLFGANSTATVDGGSY